MKSTALAVALGSWYARDPLKLEHLFQHLTPASVVQLEKGLVKASKDSNSPIDLEDHNVSAFRTIAQAAVRRIAFKQLDKYSSIARPNEIEAALKYHALPPDLQTELSKTYGGNPPSTWWEALERLREIAEADNELDRKLQLWRLILGHPMTAYVPMQCRNCGHVVPDTASNKTDSEIGLSEVEPQDDEPILELRGGWFRGRPRGAVVLQLDCPQCEAKTRWYRSGHPRAILNPNRWGRLCGEQEDLRLALAQYLCIQVRICVPLDWDHIWSEFGGPSSWCVEDDSARNFAARLDEGIGAWTGVLGIHPDPTLCEDLTEEYLRCRSDRKTIDGEEGFVGRADSCHAFQIPRYRDLVAQARCDGQGHSTQAQTVLGFVLHRSGMSSSDITAELQRAAKEYGNRNWWEL